MEKVKPDTMLILDDTNSLLSAIAAKRSIIPIFHMEAGNCYFDENTVSDVLERLDLKAGNYMLLIAHREENIDNEENFIKLFHAVNRLAETYPMPILYSWHTRSKKILEKRNF